MLLWIWVYKYLFKTLLSVLLGIYPEVELLDCMVNLFLIFLRNCHTISHKSSTILHSYQQCTWVPISPHLCQHLFVFLFIVASLMGVEWYLIVALTCISLMVSDMEHLSMRFWPFIYVLWYMNICLSPLPYLNQIVFVEF